MTAKEQRRIWLLKLNKHNLRCYICGLLIETKEDLTVDHEPPKSRQDELGASKLYPACKRCNHKKGALTLEEYKQWLKLENKRNGGKQK